MLFYMIFMFLLYTAERSNPNGTIHSMPEAIWYSIVTLTTVGYGDYYPVTPLGKVFSSFLVIGSLGLTGYVFGSVSNAINKYMENKKLGVYGTEYTDHIIIFGYDQFANNVIDQVIETEHNVVIITNKKSDIDLIHEHYEDNNNVFAMFMDYTHIEALEKVNLKEARTIFVNFEDDTETLIHFLNIKSYCPEKDIVVTIYNSSLKGTFINAGVTYIVCKNEISSKLVASFMFEPDVARLTDDIMSTATTDFHYDMIEYLIKPKNYLVGKNGHEVFMAMKNDFDAILLGFSHYENDKWNLLKNPGKQHSLNPGDYIILMANGASKKEIEDKFRVKEGKQSKYDLKK